MSRILITGPLGHIGSWLIRNLSFSRYDEVVLLDDLSSQRYPSLFNLPKQCRYRFIMGNILDYNLPSIMDDVEVVIHLAAITDAANSMNRQEEVEAVNFVGTRKVIDACIVSGAKLIFPSTTSVYGSQDELVDESCTELLPQSPYAEAKLKSEQLLLEESGDRGLDYCSCRFGTIFGTSQGMRFHTAVNKFCWQAANAEAITVWSTALDQYRPYLGVRDCGLAIEHVLQNGLFGSETYNVVTDNFTVRQVVDEIRYHIPTLEIELVDSAIMNQLSYHVSGEKFMETGWSPRDELTTGIADTMELLRGIIPGVE